MRILAPALLVLVGCVSVTGAMIERHDATAHVQPSERERVLDNAAKVLQREGWALEAQDRAAGTVTTKTMTTGTMTCGSSICNSRGTLQVTVSEAGDVSVMLHREFYFPPPGLGWFTPQIDQDVHTIERDQQKILRAILEADPGK